MRVVSLILLGLGVCASPAWAGYQEDRVRSEATAAGFAAIADRLAEASQPTVTIGRQRTDAMPRAMGTSRFGGRPDLPVGRRWPRCAGKPQSFLGQVRVADLPSAARALRRHGGTLLFFTHVRFEIPQRRVNPMWAGRCSAVVHARSGAPLRRTTPPEDAKDLRVQPAAMTFAAAPDLPDQQYDGSLTPPLGDLSIGDAWEPYFELRDDLRWPGQAIPLEHRLLGYFDQPNGGLRCYERTLTRPRPWRHLFTISWDGALGFEVADGGRLQLAISPGDLRRGRFDRVCGEFDSA